MILLKVCSMQDTSSVIVGQGVYETNTLELPLSYCYRICLYSIIKNLSMPPRNGWVFEHWLQTSNSENGDKIPTLDLTATPTTTYEDRSSSFDQGRVNVINSPRAIPSCRPASLVLLARPMREPTTLGRRSINLSSFPIETSP